MVDEFNWRHYLILNPGVIRHRNFGYSKRFAVSHYIRHGKAKGLNHKLPDNHDFHNFNAFNYLYNNNVISNIDKDLEDTLIKHYALSSRRKLSKDNSVSLFFISKNDLHTISYNKPYIVILSNSEVYFPNFKRTLKYDKDTLLSLIKINETFVDDVGKKYCFIKDVKKYVKPKSEPISNSKIQLTHYGRRDKFYVDLLLNYNDIFTNEKSPINIGVNCNLGNIFINTRNLGDDMIRNYITDMKSKTNIILSREDKDILSDVYLPTVFHKKCLWNGDVEKKYDIGILSIMTERKTKIKEMLESEGVSVIEIHNYSEDRNKLIQQCKILVDVKIFEYDEFDYSRYATSIFNKIPIITENKVNNNDLDILCYMNKFIHYASYDNIVSECKRLLTKNTKLDIDYNLLEEMSIKYVNDFKKYVISKM